MIDDIDKDNDVHNIGNQDKVLLDEYNQVFEANKRIFDKLKETGIMEESKDTNDNYIMKHTS